MISSLRKRSHSNTEKNNPTDEDDDNSNDVLKRKYDQASKLSSPRRSTTDDSTAANNEHSNHLMGGSTFFKVMVLIHLLAVVLFVLGFVWRMDLHTGQECDMTYSHRIYFEIDIKNYNNNKNKPISFSSSPSSSISPITSRFNLSNPSSSSTLTSQYRLYKFVDKRDPRYQEFWKDPKRHPQPLTGSSWCTGSRQRKNSTTTTTTTTKTIDDDLRIVLYIPGHWGSYEQSRSVGAHGLQLTRHQYPPRYTKQVMTALANNLWTGNKAVVAKEEGFVYDVYAVDFSEQGTALHGEFLMAQSQFVAMAVEQLVNSCHVSSTIIVAHSMGGYVARLTPILYPTTKPFLHDIITLATPHSNPLYAWDETVYNVHQRLLKEQQEETLIVSLTGGLRDEMIAPLACNANHHISSISAVTTKLIPRGNLGMDHQAIVWCHDVLEIVRKLIWVMTVAEGLPVKERLRRIQEQLAIGDSESTSKSQTYSDNVKELQTRSRVEFGYWKTSCMEAAMLYNLPLLVTLFAVIGGFHCATSPVLPKRFAFIMPVVACCCGWIWSQVHPFPVVILTLVATTAYTCLIYGIGLLRTGRSRDTSFRVRHLLIVLGVTFLLAQIFSLVVAYWHNGTWSFQPLDMIFYVCGVVLIYASVLQMVRLEEPVSAFGGDGHHPADAYAALVVLSMPFLVVGQILLMVWEGTARASTWYFLLKTGAPIVLVSVVVGRPSLAGIAAESHKVWYLLRSTFLVTSILCYCPWILPRGNGFRLATILKLIAWTDIGFSLLMARVTSRPSPKTH